MSFEMATTAESHHLDNEVAADQQQNPDTENQQPFLPVTPNVNNHAHYNMNAMTAPAATQAFQQMQSNTFYAQQPSPPVHVVPQKRGKEATYRFDKLTPTGTSQHPESVKRRKTIAKKSGLEAAKFTIRETARSRRRHRKAAAAKKPEWQYYTQIQRDEILKGIDETIQAEIATSDRLAEEHWNKTQTDMAKNGVQMSTPVDDDHQQDGGQSSAAAAAAVPTAPVTSAMTPPPITATPQMPIMQAPIDFQQSPLMHQMGDVIMPHFDSSPNASFNESPSGGNLSFSTDVDVMPQKRGQKAVIKFDALQPSGRSKHPAAFKRRRILSQKVGLEAAKFTIRETARSRKRNRKAALMKSAEWPTLSEEEKTRRIKEMEDRIQAEIATSDRQAEREFKEHTLAQQSGSNGTPQQQQNQQQQQPQIIHEQVGQQQQQFQQQQHGDDQDIVMGDNQQQQMLNSDMSGMLTGQFPYMLGVGDQQSSTLKVKEWSPRVNKKGTRGNKQKASEEDMAAAFLDPQLQAEDIRMRGGPAFALDPSLASAGTEVSVGQQQQPVLEALPVEQNAADNMEVVGGDQNNVPIAEPVVVEQQTATEVVDEPMEDAAKDETSKARGRPAKKGRGRPGKKAQEAVAAEPQLNTNDNQAAVDGDIQQLIPDDFGQAGLNALRESLAAAVADPNFNFNPEIVNQAIAEQAQQLAEAGNTHDGSQDVANVAAAAFEIAGNDGAGLSLSHEIGAEAEPEEEEHEVEETETAVTTSPARARGRGGARGRGRGRGRKRGGFAGRGNKAAETHKEIQGDTEDDNNQAGNEEAVLDDDGEAAAAGFMQDGESSGPVVEEDRSASPTATRRSGRRGRQSGGVAVASGTEESHQRGVTTSPNTRRRSSRHTRNPSREEIAMMKEAAGKGPGGPVRRSRRRSDLPHDMMEGYEGMEGDEANGWVMRGFRSIFKKIF